MSKKQKRITNQQRSRLGTGAGIARPKRSAAPRWPWVGGVLLLAVLAAAAVLLTQTSSNHAPSAPPTGVPFLSHSRLDAVSQPTWSNGWENLSARLAALHLPGLSDTTLHYHGHLTLYVDGRRVVIPANIGFDQPDQVASPIHTHDTTGVIHIEADDPSFRGSLQEFFDVWGVYLSSRCVGGYCSGVKAFVNGRTVSLSRSVPLAAHDAVTVVVGRPPRGFKPDRSYPFPQGE